MARDFTTLSSSELERIFEEERRDPVPEVHEQHPITQRMQQRETGDLTGRIYQLEEETRQFRKFFKISNVPVYTLPSKSVELNNPPLTVAVEQRGADDFIACLYDVDLFGYGETLPEALDDLGENIIAQFQYLSKKQAEIKLGRMPERQLRFLQTILVKSGA